MPCLTTIHGPTYQMCEYILAERRSHRIMRVTKQTKKKNVKHKRFVFYGPFLNVFFCFFVVVSCGRFYVLVVAALTTTRKHGIICGLLGTWCCSGEMSSYGPVICIHFVACSMYTLQRNEHEKRQPLKGLVRRVRCSPVYTAGRDILK